MKYDTYRDGGTKSFTASFGGYLPNRNLRGQVEICQNVKGKWYLGYPRKAMELTPEEVETIVPVIMEKLEKDLRWRTHFVKNFREKNEI